MLGKTVRLGTRSATIVGVLEPSVPYPAETEIIANVVTSPHHLSATMVHRPRAPDDGAVRPARARRDSRSGPRRAAHRPRAPWSRSIPRRTPPKADFRIDAVQLRDQITSPARTVLLVLLAASALVFVIACSNVANLILARTVRREGELAIRAALGASTGALRRTLLAESLLLCGAGAAARRADRAADGRDPGALRLALLGARARSHGRFQHALGRRRPGASSPPCCWPSSAPARRPTPRAASACRAAACASPAAPTAACASSPSRRSPRRSCCSPAPACCSRRCSRCRPRRPASTRATCSRVNVPVMSLRPHARADRRLLSGRRCAASANCPAWTASRVGTLGSVARRRAASAPASSSPAEGYVRAHRRGGSARAASAPSRPDSSPRSACPLIAGRDFNDADRRGSEPVVIVSQSLAQRMFPNQDAVNRHLMWTDPVMKFIDVSPQPRRIVGVVADVDDENVVPGPALTVYHPFGQEQIWRRPPVRPRARRSRTPWSRPITPHHPRPVRRPAGGARRDARGRPRRGADARSAERARVRRLRGRRAGDRRGRRRRRAGVLGERADARVRHPAGHRLAAARTC